MAALLRIALVLFAGMVAVCGQESGLAVSLRAPSARQDSPLAVELTFDLPGSGIIEGSLEFRFADLSGRPRIHRTNEIAITPGRSSQRMLLPPVHLSRGSLEVQLLFHGKNGARDFGTRPLAVWNSDRPPMRAGVCLGRNDFPEGGEEMWRSLRLRTYAGGSWEMPPDVFPSWIDPADAPAHVLAWCAYDLVIIGGPGFRAMRAKSLSSLARWVRAGGSLLVIADSSVNESQLAFLNELIGESSGQFSADEAGHLRMPAGLASGIHVDFGRAVVLPEIGRSPAQWETPEWRGTVAFLWKLRRDRIPRLKAEGKMLMTSPGASEYENGIPDDGYGLRRELSCLQHASLPERITPVPFSLVALVFLAFVLLIGPVDRLLLRKLRLTRWTWVVFPLVCFGFAWLMIALADAHLGREDHRGTFCIRDVGADGTVLRETRIETLFSGRAHERVTRLANATIQNLPDGEGTTTGSLLGGYDYRETARQWETRMKVVRSFEPMPDDSGLKWSAIPKQHPNRNDWPRIRQELDPDSTAVVWIRRAGSAAASAPSEYRTLCEGPAPVEFRRFLSQCSPRPGAPLEDLALIDSEDPDAWLVIAMQQTRPRETIVWRRLFRWPRP